MNNDFEENELKDDDELVSYISVTNKNPKKRTPKTMNWTFARMFPKFEDCSSDEERCIWMIRNFHKLEEYLSWVEVAAEKRARAEGRSEARAEGEAKAIIQGKAEGRLEVRAEG